MITILVRCSTRAAVLKRASKLAAAFLAALQSGGLMEAFAEAGKRMEENMNTQEEYQRALDAYMDDPPGTKMEE